MKKTLTILLISVSMNCFGINLLDEPQELFTCQLESEAKRLRAIVRKINHAATQKEETLLKVLLNVEADVLESDILICIKAYEEAIKVEFSRENPYWEALYNYQAKIIEYKETLQQLTKSVSEINAQSNYFCNEKIK